MVTECSNPSCCKPLHYLREGRVVLLEITESSADGSACKRLEHFWLCGPCSTSMYVEKDGAGGVRIMSRFKSRRPAPLPQDTPMAS